MVEAHAVGSGGDAGLPGFLGDAVVGPVRLVGIVAKVAQHGVVAVEQGDPAFEFGNGDQPRAIGGRPECDAARAAEIGDRRVDVRAVQAQALQASVLAVADDQHRLLAASVDGHAVTRVELARLAARAAECGDVLEIWTEDVDPVAAVSIGDVDAAVWRDGDGGGVVGVRIVVVLARLHWNAECPDMRAVEAKFDHLFARKVRAVEVGRPVFDTQLHVVHAGKPLGNMATERSIWIVYQGAVRCVGVEVDIATGRYGDGAVRVPDGECFVLSPVWNGGPPRPSDRGRLGCGDRRGQRG